MAGLKRVTDMTRFRNKAKAASEKFCHDGEPMEFPADGTPDTAIEDDGVLHVTRHGLRIVFDIGQDTPGAEANDKIVGILLALGMKKFITESVLVHEECEECDGEGHETCDLGCEHDCDYCDGDGVVPVSVEDVMKRTPS